MKAFSYIALSLTLALVFCLWLPNNLSFTVTWMGVAVLGLPLLIADIIALIYLIRHRKEKGVKGLAVLLMLIPVVFIIGMYAPWHSVSDKTMFKHYQRRENDLREAMESRFSDGIRWDLTLMGFTTLILLHSDVQLNYLVRQNTENKS